MSPTVFHQELARGGSSCKLAKWRAGRAGRHAGRGFTLIELMIVVAIVAILAAIAYPSYRDSVLKGKRAEGRTAVLDLLQQQERYLTQSNSYMGFTAGNSGVNGTILDASGNPQTVTIPFKTLSGDNPAKAAYQLSAQACGGFTLRDCVLISAIPNSPDPQVGTLTAQSTGQKSCSAAAMNPSAPCWK